MRMAWSALLRISSTILRNGDANLLSVFDEADAYAARNGLDLPEEPEARATVQDADCVKDPILSLDLAKSGIATIIWATGFTSDFSWLRSMLSTGTVGQSISAASRPSQAYISSVCPGSRGEAPASFGAYGMMRSISRTKSQSSATTWRITTLRSEKERRDSCSQDARSDIQLAGREADSFKV